MLVITFQIIMLNIFALKDNYPLSLWKFFLTVVSGVGCNALHN